MFLPSSLPRQHHMRLRVLISVLVAVVAFTAGVSYWLFGGSGYETGSSLMQSSALKVSFLGYTNGNAFIQISNCASHTMHLWTIEVYSRDPEHVPDWTYLSSYNVTNGSRLSAGATLVTDFPAPTNQMPWKAVVGAVDQRELNVKRVLNDYWRFRPYPSVVHPRYAQTDWIAP